MPAVCPDGHTRSADDRGPSACSVDNLEHTAGLLVCCWRFLVGKATVPFTGNFRKLFRSLSIEPKSLEFADPSNILV